MGSLPELLHLGLEVSNGGSQGWEGLEGFIMSLLAGRWRGLYLKEHTQSLRAEGIKAESQQRKWDLSPGTTRD